MIAGSKGNGQIILDPPLILKVSIKLLCGGINMAATGLGIGRRNAQQKIEPSNSGTMRRRSIEAKLAVVVSIEGIRNHKRTAFEAHLQGMFANNFAEVVRQLISSINSGLRAVAAEAEVEQASQVDSGNAGAGCVLRVDAESEGGW